EPLRKTTRAPVEASPRPAAPGPAVRIQRPSGLNDAEATGPKCQRSSWSGLPEGTAQIRTSLSRLAVTSRLPSGEKATDVILASCARQLRTTVRIRASTSFTVPSDAPRASSVPSGERATVVGGTDPFSVTGGRKPVRVKPNMRIDREPSLPIT